MSQLELDDFFILENTDDDESEIQMEMRKHFKAQQIFSIPIE